MGRAEWNDHFVTKEKHKQTNKNNRKKEKKRNRRKRQKKYYKCVYGKRWNGAF
jgi:hypothetical protein